MIFRMRTINGTQNLEKFLACEMNQLEHDLQHGAENNTEELDWTIRFAEKMFPNSILMLCNARHKNFKYISEVCKDLLGYSVEQFHEIMRDGFLGIVHPDDSNAVSLCFRHLAQHATRKDLTRMRFIMYYRLRHASGRFLHVTDEKLVIESRNGLYVGFTLIKDVSETTGVSLVRIETLVQKAKRYIKINEFVPSREAGSVSAREQDIISLVKEGISNKDIAVRLSLSVHTIKNHKKKLFKKMNVRNSLELMRRTNLVERY